MNHRRHSIAGLLALATALVAAGCGGSDAATYTISGTIAASSGVSTSGITVFLISSSASASVQTDTTGGFTFDGVPSGTYTLTPFSNTYSFGPTTRTITVSGNVTTSFTMGQEVTARITGLPITGATVTLTPVTSTADGGSSDGGTDGGSSAAVAQTTTLSATGTASFTFSGVANGTYTVTPTLTGYGFYPASQTVTVTGSDKSLSDFACGFVASGTITGTTTCTLTGYTLNQVTLTVTPIDGGTAMTNTITADAGTDAGWAFSLGGLDNGTYVVTASGAVAYDSTDAGQSDFSFYPTSATVTIADGGVAVGSFNVGHSISGTVTSDGGTGVSGVSFTLTSNTSSSFSRSFTTSDGGTYALTGLPNDNYTLLVSYPLIDSQLTYSSLTIRGQDYLPSISVFCSTTATDAGSTVISCDW